MNIDDRYLYKLDDMNDTTITLLLELYFNDIKELLFTDKNKGREGEYSNVDSAVLTYQNEFKERDTIIIDRSMTRSFTRAVFSDAAMLWIGRT